MSRQQQISWYVDQCAWCVLVSESRAARSSGLTWMEEQGPVLLGASILTFRYSNLHATEEIVNGIYSARCKKDKKNLTSTLFAHQT
ncbi:hypothetical protein U9M48_028066 [Paspalum notatum var. saurae]|uniref:Uncharacterized protein n=1 Tax=Paspalum notatum var. saurae TaxID=547442 RepID=A0AAQ3X136_PASNO